MSATSSDSGNLLARLVISEGFSVTHTRNTAAQQVSTNYTISPKMPWNPVVSVRLDEFSDVTTISESLRFYIQAGQKYFLNPTVQYTEEVGGYSETSMGGQGYYFMAPGHKLGVDLNYNNRLERLDKEGTYYFSRGTHQIDVSVGERTESTYTSMRYSWRPSGQGLALSVAGKRMDDGAYTLLAQIQGSFIPAAKQIVPLQTRDTGLLFVQIIDGATGQKLSGKIEVNGVMHTIDGQGLIPVTPYQYHRIRVISDFDYEPEKQVFEIFTARGSVTSLDLKMVPVVDIDGYIASGKDGISMVLLDDNDREACKAKTRFGGYYYFRVAKKTGNYRVKEGQDDDFMVAKGIK